MLLLSGKIKVQRNLDLTKCHGTGETICSLNRGFVISRVR